MPDLTISIVTYNSRHVVGHCLATLPPGIEIRLYDNASTDGTSALVRREFPHVTVTAGPENIGFGRAHNENLKQSATPFVLVLNPDCFPDAGTLTALLAMLRKHPDAAMAGPGFRTPEDADHPGAAFVPADETQDSDFISGACMLLRMSAIRDIGLFDPNLFLFFEDTDLCTRARRSGYRLIHASRIRVTHLVGRSTPATLRDSVRRDFHLGWSEVYYGCKYRGNRSTWHIKRKVISRHLRKTLQRALRLSPTTLESASRTWGAIKYAYSGPVAIPPVEQRGDRGNSIQLSRDT
jgi:GT2 family glycosyltransferase